MKLNYLPVLIGKNNIKNSNILGLTGNNPSLCPFTNCPVILKIFKGQLDKYPRPDLFHMIFNRPGVAGVVLQSPLLLTD